MLGRFFDNYNAFFTALRAAYISHPTPIKKRCQCTIIMSNKNQHRRKEGFRKTSSVGLQAS